MPTLTINGLAFEVLDQGQGPVIVFLHGFPLSHAMWSPQIEEFRKDYRIIAPDLRGFGGSSYTAGTVTMRQFADDVLAILDQLGITHPITLCGLSMGGYIAWQFVENYPERVNGLILCDTKASADSEDAAKNRHKLAESVLERGAEVVAQAMSAKLFANDTLKNRTEIVDQCKDMMLANHPEGIAAALRGMAERPEMSSLLPKITVPTLVVVGEEDQITTAEEMSQMAQAIPGAAFLKVPKAGHMAPLEQPEPVNGAIKRFMESLVKSH